jgi:rifampin ADP-ribosylating transferase
MGENGTSHAPVTYDSCARIGGPSYHGTKSVLAAGDELVPGYGSTFQERRVSNHIYFTARDPLRVVAEVDGWHGHDPEVLTGMLDHLAQLREQGLDVIED